MGKCPAGFSPDKMAFPLIPTGGDYKAPLTQAAQAANPGGGNVSADQGIQMALNNPQLLAQVGIQPGVVAAISTSGLSAALSEDKIDPAKLLEAGFKFYQAGGCDPIISAVRRMMK